MASDCTALASVVKVVGLVAVLLLAGVLARRDMKVNYTRKINHLAMTLTEANSPHAWDTPFLMLVGYGTLLGVMQL